MQTFPFDLQGHGIFKKTFTRLPVNQHSAVLASASELHFADGAMRPFIGDAFVHVISIAPQDNGNVDLKIHVDWNSDLTYRVTLVVL
jgi:hypothetical protein